jgi:hypothetical protein
MSEGIRSAVNCTRLHWQPVILAKFLASSGLAQPRVVLEQDVPVGQRRGEHLHQQYPFADEYLAYRVDDAIGQRFELMKFHFFPPSN